MANWRRNVSSLAVIETKKSKNDDQDRNWLLLSSIPAMDDLQTGHVRHIKNIANQLPNDWSNMGTKLSWQENFEAFRYQLAYMAFAIGLTHFHRLPGAPGYFRSTFDGLLQKMLLPDVWYFWRETSRGGGGANLDAPLGGGQVNPVDRDNIMYSAYVHAMSWMYKFLFNDDKYSEDGALTFTFNPILFRLEERENFIYNQQSLSEHIYWRMVESGYLGVACEPYCTFQICQQPAILGFRLQDIACGTDRAAEITEGYQQAWSQFGQVDPEGGFSLLVKTHTGEVLPNIAGAWSDGWLGALLNMWNPNLVRNQYPRAVSRWVTEIGDGTAFVPPLESKGKDVSAGSALDFGFFSMWVSEMGDANLLNRLLNYAQKHMSPTWKDGGFFYPRNDEYYNESGAVALVSPCLGNALLPYARLNVPNGLWKMYNEPWHVEHFAEPRITRISDDVDVKRAIWIPLERKFVFTIESSCSSAEHVILFIENVWRDSLGDWNLWADGNVVANYKNGSISATNIDLRREGVGLELRMRRCAMNNFVLGWE